MIFSIFSCLFLSPGSFSNLPVHLLRLKPGECRGGLHHYLSLLPIQVALQPLNQLGIF